MYNTITISNYLSYLNKKQFNSKIELSLFLLLEKIIVIPELEGNLGNCMDLINKIVLNIIEYTNKELNLILAKNSKDYIKLNFIINLLNEFIYYIDNKNILLFYQDIIYFDKLINKHISHNKVVIIKEIEYPESDKNCELCGNILFVIKQNNCSIYKPDIENDEFLFCNRCNIYKKRINK